MDIFEEIANSVKAPPSPTSGRLRLEQDYAEPYQAWKADGNPKTMSALLKSVNPVIDSAVRPLGDSPILRSRAKQIAIKAFQNYDPAKASIRTHLMNQFQGLRRYSAQQASPIRVPERVALHKRTVDRETANFMDEFGRDPTDGELAARIGIPAARIRHVRQWRPAVSEARAAGPEGDGPAVLGQDNTARAIAQEFVYSSLTANDQLIFDFATGSNGRQPLKGREIAARLGITPSAVSQRLAAIEGRFNQIEDMGMFGG